MAVRNDLMVGLSSLVKRGGATTVLGTGGTGVLPAFRRQGLATRLKLKAIGYARELGTMWITTDNEENNPMYGLNRQLGFAPQPAWTHWSLRPGQ